MGDKMIKEDLKKLDIKITELSDYLKISRPTLYKFMEMYDSKKTKELDKRILDLFNYINKNIDLIEKRNVINYIFNKFSHLINFEDNSLYQIINNVREYVINNPNTEKTFFIDEIIKSKHYDLVIHYLYNISNIISKNKLTDEEKELLAPYKQIIKLYTQKGGIKNE